MAKKISNLFVKMRRVLGHVAKNISDKWLPHSQVMTFPNYGPTQMAALEKNDAIVVAKVGKRKFILRESLEKMLDNSILPSGEQ